MEFDTWFHQTSLKSLDSHSAVVEVPNKFIANWFRDNYLKDLKISFKEILKETPDIVFIYTKNQKKQGLSKAKQGKKPNLYMQNSINRTFTFDNFITGECNRFAFSSAYEVSERPGNKYNPLFIFCSSSLGKTHLLHSIGNHLLKKNQACRAEYIASEIFISDYNRFARDKNFSTFKKKYKNLDILLFDDIQHLSGRSTVQEVFLSIMKSFFENNKQIIITGDRPPTRLKEISPHLKSRLGSGLITEIKDIDLKTKTDIIKQKISECSTDIPDDIISFLLKTSNNIKILMKNIVRIETYASLNKKILNISAIKSFIKDRNNIELDHKDIQSVTSGYFNISMADLLSNKKKRLYSYPRQLAMFLCRKHLDISFKEIGRLFGNRDHSTILYAIKKIEKLRKLDKKIREDLNNIEKLLVL